MWDDDRLWIRFKIGKFKMFYFLRKRVRILSINSWPDPNSLTLVAVANPQLFLSDLDQDPDPGGKWITDPARSGSYLDILCPIKKTFCKIGGKLFKRLNTVLYFFLKFFKSLININSEFMDPNPGVPINYGVWTHRIRFYNTAWSLVAQKCFFILIWSSWSYPGFYVEQCRLAYNPC